MDLAEFLLARIAEDEAAARNPFVVIASPIGIWDQARVLAECEAKRRIVEGAQRVALPDPRDYWQGAGDALDGVLKLLAAPYADHPDYRPEWSPTVAV